MIPEQIQELIDAEALFVINHSGGKDSQAMTLMLEKLIPEEQRVIVHAHLPEVEWEGVKEHIESTSMGIPVFYVQAGKTFLGMVEKRGMFPSKKNRQCTSDLKRAPIQKFINNFAKERGFQIVVNCMGLRAEESSDRAKKEVLKLNERASCGHRTQYEWLPIHSMKIDEVWESISAAGLVPHWAYAAGMSRLSCCFCIMSSKQDIKTAARLNPELAQRYIDLEAKTGQSLLMPQKNKSVFLIDIINS